VDVSIETCAHYLFFTEEDVLRLGAVAKCAPPLRPADDQRALWDELLRGHVDMVTSDHSPTTPERKSGDFASAWGGIGGVQSTLPVLLDRGLHARNLPIERIASLVASEPARRFRIRGKGSLAVGNDADIVLVNPAESCTLTEGDLHQRHKTSPYVGSTFRGSVKTTIRRGEPIFEGGRIVAASNGQMVRPEIRKPVNS
jgi:allantoinase